MAQFTFAPPANISDFPLGSPLDKRLKTVWNWNLIGDTLTGIAGDPWNVANDLNRYFYFDPTTTEIPSDAVTVPIQWVAFPNRIQWYFSAGGSPGNPFRLSSDEILELADTGKVAGKPAFANGFPAVPTSACPGLDWGSNAGDWQTFGPPGPRGWQDEYCEWSVTRDPASNKIISVMFTCENPDYWFTLWQVDPATVLKIYREAVSSHVQLADLCLTDAEGNPVVNPLTGLPAYNPINKWNAGPVTTPGVRGGAMHLTSPPNTLGAEVYLAAAATLLRNVTTYDPQSMICCSRYGQPFRNSDPHIGFNANQLAKQGFTLSLADPVGLYIQEPDWGVYQTPDNTPASQFWTVTRGKSPDQILHAVFAVPPSKGYTVSDITINGKPILWGGQIPQTFQIQLRATGFSTSALPPQQALPCVTSLATDRMPQPFALIPNNLLNAYNALFTIDGQVTNGPVLPAPSLRQGQTADLALQCSDVATNPTISFGDGVSVTINAVDRQSNAVGSDRAASALGTHTFQITIAVAQDAAPGQRAVTVLNPGQATTTAAPAFLTIVAADWSAVS